MDGPNDNRKLMSVRLDRELIRLVKVEAAARERPIERVVEDILAAHFAGHPLAHRRGKPAPA